MTVIRRCVRCGAVDRGASGWGIDHAASCDGPVTDTAEVEATRQQLQGAVEDRDRPFDPNDPVAVLRAMNERLAEQLQKAVSRAEYAELRLREVEAMHEELLRRQGVLGEAARIERSDAEKLEHTAHVHKLQLDDDELMALYQRFTGGSAETDASARVYRKLRDLMDKA